ncbi:TetR/AcrR family transcriptional regulator [Microbispora amethystogenes]|uniref:TetR family transcriptional regulator n=1 Tax=Microbispora amethystogenes TaxID=1427754 RepID=A0ABQ4FHE7_9ACTN|nr:TetR/AcrR family transcriptional regulator [Microbispora amethystogenes]GIH34221.1 TetR family transcriptional regulator [Microbispora amethystogenes]
MGEQRAERADAARNRRAILGAAEELLRSHAPDEVSIERIAAAAGVGKGTVFHRFGSRVGLMRALMEERVRALGEAVAGGPPPLGPGAPPRDRLVAFLDAVVGVAARNGRLITAHDHALATRRHAEGRLTDNPVYLSWHAHVTSLIAEARPDLDADLVAHVLVGSMHNEGVARLLLAGESERVAAGMRAMAESLLR